MDPIPPGAIAATNVRPAFETSLHFGASLSELEAATGLTRPLLADDAATVSAEATYAHMELMFAKPRFGEFLVAAAQVHTLPSLGVVGLACKTVATVGEAMRCHARFQHLTNRTAHYDTSVRGEHVVIEETRYGPPRLGSLLISDYTMLIAAQLIRASAAQAPGPTGLSSRRAKIDAAERIAYETFLGAPVERGSTRASLAFPRELLDFPIVSADSELAAYFRGVLQAAGPMSDSTESPLLREIRVAIRDKLVHGTPTAESIAKRMGVGARTLQRRLAGEGVAYADVLESTRKALAQCYLADRRLSQAEIAYLLGYREQSSFYRAFKRWVGQTPATYRAALKTTGA